MTPEAPHLPHPPPSAKPACDCKKPAPDAQNRIYGNALQLAGVLGMLVTAIFILIGSIMGSAIMAGTTTVAAGACQSKNASIGGQETPVTCQPKKTRSAWDRIERVLEAIFTAGIPGGSFFAMHEFGRRLRGG